jgi:hypothetical protein
MLQVTDLSLEPFMTAETKKEAIYKARSIVRNCLMDDVVWVHVFNIATDLSVASFQVKRKAA